MVLGKRGDGIGDGRGTVGGGGWSGGGVSRAHQFKNLTVVPTLILFHHLFDTLIFISKFELDLA
jgi:hypothetical protein